MLPELVFHLNCKILEFRQDLLESRFPDGECLNFSDCLIHEVESAIITNVEASYNCEHSEPDSVVLCIVDLVADLVVAVLNKYDLEALVNLRSNQSVARNQSNFKCIHYLEHELAVRGVVVLVVRVPDLHV